MPVAAAIGGAVGLGGLVGGTAGSLSQVQGGQSGPQSAARGTLSAYQQTAPGQLALNQMMDPQYAALSSNDLNQIMFGGAGGQQTYQVPTVNKAGQITGYTTQTMSTQASPGMLNMMGSANSLYGPAAQALWQRMYPGQAQLQSQLGADASQQLELGGAMDPMMQMQVQQATRQAQAARGMGYGPSDVFQEAMNTGMQAQALRQQREGYATQTGTYLAQTQPNYTQTGGQILQGGAGLAFQQPQYDPFNSASVSMSAQNASQNYGAAQQRAGIYAGMGSSLMNIGSGMIKGS